MHYNKKANVIRVTPVDTLTGEGETEAIHIEDLPCRIVQPRGTEEVRFGKIARVADFNLYCAVVDIRRNDKIVYNDETYTILNIKPIQEGSASFLKIALGYAE